MKLTKASNKAIRHACTHYHYSKSVPVNPFAFNVFNDLGEWCGCILYSLGANPNLGKPYGLYNGQVIELTRMALNGKQESTSKALALSIKLLKKYLPLVKMIISFADANQNHIGTIYQATNWYYTGKGKSTPEYYLNGRWIHQRQLGSLGYKVTWAGKNLKTRQCLDKYRYLFPLDKIMVLKCKQLSQPYPKKETQHAAIA